MNQWIPWEQATDDQLSSIRGICFDVDDTFSTEGQITAEAFDALWRARQAGLTLVPVTGRPAGWCDHFARFWPIDAVVGENGAFTFFMHQGVRQRLNTPMQWTPQEAQAKLATLRDAILERFPHAKWASDQLYREYDLAIDVYEDVEPWPDNDVEVLMDMCAEHGAEVKLSSVHVNTWFGDYNKYKGFTHWLASNVHPPTQAPSQNMDSWIYLGDSPNDEPMFRRFAHCVGVANALPFADRMIYGPRWVTTGVGGAGFTQVVDRLVAR